MRQFSDSLFEMMLVFGGLLEIHFDHRHDWRESWTNMPRPD